MPDLLSGRVAAATAFWSDEGVALEHASSRASTSSGSTPTARRPTPSWCCARRARRSRTTRRSPARWCGRSSAAIELAVVGPARRRRPTSSAWFPGLTRADQRRPGSAAAGVRRARTDARASSIRAVLRAWARWEARFGIVSSPPNVARASTAFSRSAAERAPGPRAPSASAGRPARSRALARASRTSASTWA